jgi:hypothetical protein
LVLIIRCWQISRYLQDWSRKLASNCRYFGYSPDTAHGFLDPEKGCSFVSWETAMVATFREGGLVAWAEASGQRTRGRRFAVRVLRAGVNRRLAGPPVTSRARQRKQAEALVRGHGHIVAEFFDEGESRLVAWGRRAQAAALVALLADACRVWDAIVVGEYERAFYGSQYALMAPLFEHYGVQLWMPEAAGGSISPRSMMSRR